MSTRQIFEAFQNSTFSISQLDSYDQRTLLPPCVCPPSRNKTPFSFKIIFTPKNREKKKVLSHVYASEFKSCWQYLWRRLDCMDGRLCNALRAPLYQERHHENSVDESDILLGTDHARRSRRMYVNWLLLTKRVASPYRVGYTFDRWFLYTSWNLLCPGDLVECTSYYCCRWLLTLVPTAILWFLQNRSIEWGREKREKRREEDGREWLFSLASFQLFYPYLLWTSPISHVDAASNYGWIVILLYPL